MTIGHQPTRDRVILPRREGVPLAHVFNFESALPAETTAYIYLYDANEEELAFWPLTVDGAEVTMDIASEEWWPYRSTARSFTVFVIYSAEPTKKWPSHEGAVLRTV